MMELRAAPCAASCSGRTTPPARAPLRCVAGQLQRKEAFSPARLKKGGRPSTVPEAVRAPAGKAAKLANAYADAGDASTIVVAKRLPQREVAVAIPYRVGVTPHTSPASSSPPKARRTRERGLRIRAPCSGHVRARGRLAWQLAHTSAPTPTCTNLQPVAGNAQPATQCVTTRLFRTDPLPLLDPPQHLHSPISAGGRKSGCPF